MTTPQDALQVLAKISLLDPFFPKPDAGMAIAWAETLSVHGLGLEDLLNAVPLLFADEYRTRDRVLPVDIIVKARELRRDRIERDPAEQQRLLAEQDARIAEIESRPLKSEIDGPRPAGDEDVLRRIRERQELLAEEGEIVDEGA